MDSSIIYVVITLITTVTLCSVHYQGGSQKEKRQQRNPYTSLTPQQRQEFIKRFKGTYAAPALMFAQSIIRGGLEVPVCLLMMDSCDDIMEDDVVLALVDHIGGIQGVEIYEHWCRSQMVPFYYTKSRSEWIQSMLDDLIE